MSRTHPVTNGAVTSDAETLVNAMATFQTRLCCRIGIGEFSPRFGDVGMKPLDVSVRTGIVRLDCLLLPVLLSLDPVVRILEPQTLNITDEGFDILLSEILKWRHQRFGTGVPGVHEVSNMPIIRMFSAFLGKIRSVPSGP